MQTATIIHNLNADDLKNIISQAISEHLGKSTPAPLVDVGYHSRKETAKILHVSLPTLDKYTESGMIRGSRFGRRILYSLDDITTSLKQIQNVKFRRGR